MNPNEKYPSQRSSSSSGYDQTLANHPNAVFGQQNIPYTSGYTVEMPPPPPYEAKHQKGAPNVGIYANVLVNPALVHTLNTQQQGQKIPVKVVPTVPSDLNMKGNLVYTSSSGQSTPGYSSPALGSPIHTLPGQGQVNGGIPVNMSNTSLKTRLHYDVVPPRKPGPSEAEKKLAALTQQLENEMQISSPKRTLPTENVPLEPPPPYHGPHNTEPSPAPYRNVVNMAAPNMQNMQPLNMQSVNNQHGGLPNHGGCQPHVTGLGSYSSNTSSTSLSSQSSGLYGNQLRGPMAVPLSYQVTQPLNRGLPSEAEKKINALTQQLEDEMENNPTGEYFGKFLFLA
jgi:hypothetical protein